MYSVSDNIYEVRLSLMMYLLAFHALLYGLTRNRSTTTCLLYFLFDSYLSQNRQSNGIVLLSQRHPAVMSKLRHIFALSSICFSVILKSPFIVIWRERLDLNQQRNVRSSHRYVRRVYQFRHSPKWAASRPDCTHATSGL